MPITPDEEVPIVTSTKGCGVFPCAVSPAGGFTPAETAEAPKTTTGRRYINARTGDYAIDPDTRNWAQMPSVRQQIVIALGTVRGSSTAMPRLGSRNPRKIRQSIQAEIENDVRTALAHLLREDDPKITLDAVLVQRTGTNRLEKTIVYTDLTTGEEDDVTF